MQAYILRQSSVVSLGKQVCCALYFAGCDFKCPFCFTPELLESRSEFLVDVREIQKLIEQHTSLVTGVLFTGGEPLLQRPALLALANFSKKLGLKVAVHTNGSKPSVLKSLIEAQVLDTLIWDVKTPFVEALFESVTKSKTFFAPTSQILKDLHETLQILAQQSGLIDLEIRTTLVPGLLYKKENLFAIAQMIAPLRARWILQPFNPYKPLASKTLQGVHEPSEDFMKTLREALMKEFPEQLVEIQTLDDNYLKDLNVESSLISSSVQQ